MNKIEESLRSEILSLVAHKLFPGSLDKLLKACYINLIEDQNNFKLLDSLKKNLTDPQDISFITECFNALLLLIIEFQRKNFVVDEIQYSLRELGFSAPQVEGFLEKHNKFLEFIGNKDNENVANKFDSSINLCRLMDVEWRNEYIIGSKYLNKINRDQYRIKLKVLNDKNELVPVEFKCGLEELTELVHSLNVACKCIENASDLKHVKWG